MANASTDPGLQHTTSSSHQPSGPLATADQPAAEDAEPPIGLAGSSSSIHKSFDDDEGTTDPESSQRGGAPPHADVGLAKSTRGFLIDKVRGDTAERRRPLRSTSVELQPPPGPSLATCD